MAKSAEDPSPCTGALVFSFIMEFRSLEVIVVSELEGLDETFLLTAGSLAEAMEIAEARVSPLSSVGIIHNGRRKVEKNDSGLDVPDMVKQILSNVFKTVNIKMADHYHDRQSGIQLEYRCRQSFPFVKFGLQLIDTSFNFRLSPTPGPVSGKVADTSYVFTGTILKMRC